MSAIIGAIAGLATIVGGIVYLVKSGFWLAVKTPVQKQQDIISDEQKKEQDAKDTGRPQ